jgi:hypothetical protein
MSADQVAKLDAVTPLVTPQSAPPDNALGAAPMAKCYPLFIQVAPAMNCNVATGISIGPRP